MRNKPYPQNQMEWRRAIQAGIGVDEVAGRDAYLTGSFPVARLEKWIMATFSARYAPDFVSALHRNIQGLLHWVYADGPEPNWRGAEDVN